MTKAKIPIVTIDEPLEPNIVWTYPIFHLPNDPDNKFAVFDIFWAKEYSNLGTPDPQDKIAVERAAVRANDLKDRGIVLVEGEYFVLRDVEEELAISILKNELYPPIKIFLVSGPVYDKRAIEAGKVALN